MNQHKPPGKLLFSSAQIRSRVKILAKQITQHYQGQPILVVGIMSGSLFFMTDLLRRLPPDTTYECWRVSSYHGVESSGEVRLDGWQHGKYGGRHVLVVEDILDSGRTLHEVRLKLLSLGAEEVRVCVLLNKQVPRIRDIPADWEGFKIKNQFVVGYGLDFNGAYRMLPAVRILPSDHATA